MSRKDLFVLPLDRFVSTPLNKASSLLSRVLMLLLLMGMALPATATLTIDNITWGVKGLDSNDESTGPNQFPEGARICSDVDATNTTVTFNWTDGLGKYVSSAGADTYINLRDDTLDVITLSILAGECKDAYFEVEINRDSAAYDNSREFFMTADDGVTAAVSTLANREVFIEHLISQSRNAVLAMAVKVSTEPDSSYLDVDAGATMTLVVGETYHIKMNASTATQGYEQLESFVNFPNIIFQVVSVETTYSAASGLGSLTSNDLYSDACVWDEDTTSANYRSCLLTGKAGGDIETIYELKILQIPGAPLVNPQPLTTLIHDFSGSSYHYNADFGTSVRYALIVGSTIEKSFVPRTIAPGSTSTLTFTITNPKSTAVSNVTFIDDLPAGVNLDTGGVTYSGCSDSSTPSPTSGSLTDPLTFTDISIAGYGICTIEVTVTAPAAGIYNNVSENLMIDGFDTLSNATDTLVVTDLPPAPTSCNLPIVAAAWTYENETASTATDTSGSLNPVATTSDLNANAAASYVAIGGSAPSSSGIANSTTFPTGWNAPTTADNWWGILNGWPSSAPADPTVNGISPYFEFQVDANDFGVVDFTTTYVLKGNWSNAGNWYVLTSLNGTTWTLSGTGVWTKNVVGTISGTTAVTGSPVYFRVFFEGAQYTGSAPKQTTGVAYLNDSQFSVCPRPSDPEMQKSFGTDPLALGGISTLTFSVQNPDANESLVGVGFSDTLPAGIVVADTPTVVDFTCTPGTIDSSVTPGDTLSGITADANTSLVEMSEEYTLSPGADCSFSVDVKGVVDGDYINTTTNITSTFTGPNTTGGANVGYGQDTITINPTPQISKVFGASSILTGDTTTLTFSITNPSIGGITLTSVAFTDTLPTGVTVGTPNNQTSDCGGTLSAADGSGSISLSGATLTAGASCSITVDVIGVTVGLKTNTTGTITSDQGDGNTATADILVKDPVLGINILKQVGLTSLGPWFKNVAVTEPGTVFYKFTVENTGDTALSLVDLSDPDLSSPATSTCTWDGDADVATAPYGLPLFGITTCVLGGYATVNTGLINTATADDNNPGAANATASNSAEYTITALTLDKTASQGSYAAAGETITYSYLVTNTGTADLAGPVTVADDKTSVTCPAIADGILSQNESITCTSSHVTIAADVLNGSITNIAKATIANGGSPVDSNIDIVFVQGPQAGSTAVTIGKIELTTAQTGDFLSSLGVNDASIEDLLALLAAWDPELAVSLVDADRQTLFDALNHFLDPDGDGQTAIIRWDTLEERGTIGFYVERKEGSGEWQRINNAMLPGLIVAPMGAEYQLADPAAQAGTTYDYQIIEQEARGTTQTYGPFTLEIK